MGKWGSFEYGDLIAFSRKLNTTQKKQDEFFRICANELAQKLLHMVKDRTPYGTGQLRRNWTSGEIRKQGNSYVIEITNPTDYAKDVEFGHRTSGRKGWVKGALMMTVSEQEIQSLAPKLLEDKLEEWLRRCLDVE